jgi:MFS family permease
MLLGQISSVVDDAGLTSRARICLGLGMSLMDASIVATALYSIGKDFQESSSTLNWVALAYTLAFLGCAVVFSRMADIVGRRNAFLAGFVIFFAFSLGCGFANNLAQLIACRALQGIGGSGTRDPDPRSHPY